MEIREQSFSGKTFKVIKGTQHPDYSFDTFEKEEKDFRDQYWKINNEDVILDIGASYGSYALSACAMGATVFAFEPEKTVYDDLVKNIEINNWQNKCFAMNIGLWSNKTSIDMKSYAPHWPQYSITSDYSADTIDNIIKDNKITKIDWIKIDVEGAEENVIRGGLKTISQYCPKLIIECHTFLDANITNNIKKLLSSICEYSYEEISRPPHIMLYATRKE